MNMAIQPETRGDDDAIEQEIQAKGKTAPRVTTADIEANVATEHYFTGLNAFNREGSWEGISDEQTVKSAEALSLLTFCVLVLRNGFTVTGESACVSPGNFDAEIGRKIARQNAVAKVWPLLGYELRTVLSRTVLTDGDALADLNGAPRPDTPSRGDA
ncbi:Gp49 family protein [Burkholderia ubonensis]|uniref:Gp49 family protein n=1 Tax=Burkholderia ubonensis TaxID=101571 RepID=UPI0009B488D0